MKAFVTILSALWMLCASTAPSYAPPVFAAVFVAVGVGAVTAGILGSIVFSVGLSMVASALRGGGSGYTPPEQNPFGIKSTLQTGGVVPRSFGFGKFCTAGSEIYPARTWGKEDKTPNAYLTRWIALSDLPMEGLDAIIVDDKRCEYGSGTPHAYLGLPISEYFRDGKDHLWVKFYDGTQTVCDEWSNLSFGGDADYPYGSDHIGAGVAYVIVTTLINQELFPSIPQFKYEGRGAKFYDPREDSTAGGSGSQRWDDPATWEHTYNPAVIKYNVLRGITFGGQWLFGLQGTDAARLPLDSWFAAMNVDDETVETAPGVNGPQFQCGGECTVNEAPVEFLDELNKCDAGRIAEAGGIFKTRSGASSAAVMSFTDAELIITAPQTFDMFPGLEQTINGVSATYPEPVQNWAITDAPSLFDADLEGEDGGRRLIAALTFNFVFSQSQVQRLMKAAREEGRKFRKHTVIAPPVAFQLEPLDIIAWTSPRNGYSNKLFQAIPTDQNDLDQVLVLVEVDPADYDWDSEVDYTDYTPIAVVQRPPATQEMTGWAVSAHTLPGANGRTRSAIKLQWDTEEIDDVEAIQYEVRDPSDDSHVVSGITYRFPSGYAYISENILPATDYEVRAKYVPFTRRPTAWTDWLPVTTDPAVIIGDDIENAILTWAKFAAGITPVQQVDDLDDAEISGDGTALAILTTDGKLYRHAGGVWVAVVRADDLVGTITSTQIADDAITTPKLATNAVTAAEIASNAVTSDKIQANSVVAGKLGVGAVNAGNILAGNIVVTGHLVANAITKTSASMNGSGDASVGVTVSSDAYAVVIQAVVAGISGGGFDVRRNGSSIVPFVLGGGGNAQACVDSPGAGSHTYAIVAGSIASTIIVTQYHR